MEDKGSDKFLLVHIDNLKLANLLFSIIYILTPEPLSEVKILTIGIILNLIW